VRFINLTKNPSKKAKARTTRAKYMYPNSLSMKVQPNEIARAGDITGTCNHSRNQGEGALEVQGPLGPTLGMLESVQFVA